MRRAVTMTLCAAGAMLMSGFVRTAAADAVYGCGDIIATGNKGEILSVTWDGTTHLTSELVCGKTRVYNAANVGVPSAYPAPGADDFCFDRTMHTTDNGAYLKTLFDVYSTTFFVFENNGNDDATWYGIHENGTLRPGVLVDASKVAKNTHYTTGLGCQRLMGYCFKTDVPVKGIRIVGRGFDAYSISCIPIPEPATLTLLALGGAAALRRRTARRL